MGSKVLLDSNVVASAEVEPAPKEEIAVPARWSYDEERGELYMEFKDGSKSTILSSKAILGEEKDSCRIATLENSRQVLLKISARNSA